MAVPPNPETLTFRRDALIIKKLEEKDEDDYKNALVVGEQFDVTTIDFAIN